MLEGLFKRLVDGAGVVYNFWNVPISGVFSFDELKLSSSLVGWVYDEFAVGSKCVSNRPDEVRSVVCRSIYCVPEGCILVWCILVPSCLVCRLVRTLVLGVG